MLVFYLLILAHFYIKIILVKISKILIIIQRSNGDVFLSAPLINALYNHYNNPRIDLLVNDDTQNIAKTLKYINQIHLFSYHQKRINPIKQEINIIKKIYKKYDLSINLTSSDRSVLYSILASKFSISAIEKSNKKSWWKKLFLSNYYNFDANLHIIQNNTTSLNLLGISNNKITLNSQHTAEAKENILKKLDAFSIKKFIIFHPSAQYNYKIYPKDLRISLLKSLNQLDIPIIITGANSKLDLHIKSELPKLKNIYDFIGETSLDELIALSDLCLAYIGMDTLNMHIAASQNKRIFAIFGPTIISAWSPWSNEAQKHAITDKPIQTYGNIILFQANMKCVACGLAGCDNKNGESECLYEIKPEIIFKEVKNWLIKFQ
jgi:heptosyltransferase-3